MPPLHAERYNEIPSQLGALMSFSNLSHFSHPLNKGNIIKVAGRIFWSLCKEPTFTSRYVTPLSQIIDPWVHWLLCSCAHKILRQPRLQCCWECCHFYLCLWSRICIGRSYQSQSPSRSPCLSSSPAKRGTPRWQRLDNWSSCSQYFHGNMLPSPAAWKWKAAGEANVAALWEFCSPTEWGLKLKWN